MFRGTLTIFVVNVLDVAEDTTPPTVTNVLVRGSTWMSSFPSYAGYAIPVGSGAQLVTLPWVNIDQIKVVFSENVAIDKADLALSGVTTTTYNVSAGTFAYDAGNFTATWTLPQAIGADKLMIRLNADGASPIQDAATNRLDGEWTNPASTTQPSSDTYPSGNGSAGGNFLFRFNVLPGDATQDGYADSNDLAKVLANYNQLVGMTWAQGDFNGDAAVDSNDLAVLLANYNQSLPALEPVAAMPGDANLDGKVDSNDLAKVLANYNQTNGMTWSQGDFNGDKAVDSNDLAVLLANYNQSLPALEPLVLTLAAPVPELATPALLASQPAEAPFAVLVSAAPDVATAQPDANFGAGLVEPASIRSDTNQLGVLTTEQCYTVLTRTTSLQAARDAVFGSGIVDKLLGDGGNSEQFHTVPKRAAPLQTAHDAVFGSGIVDKLLGDGGDSDSEADAVIGGRFFADVRRTHGLRRTGPLSPRCSPAWPSAPLGVADPFPPGINRVGGA